VTYVYDDVTYKPGAGEQRVWRPRWYVWKAAWALPFSIWNLHVRICIGMSKCCIILCDLYWYV